ncbi:GNAT family N-acetyltransferase [Catellatospora bangladeshensis]|uniref:GNAT family N-acetyltransferase n=1 Tax=Catellatospora bangladeshensis TaxID=310355 RepID=UPI003623DA4E
MASADPSGDRPAARRRADGPPRSRPAPRRLGRADRTRRLLAHLPLARRRRGHRGRPDGLPVDRTRRQAGRLPGHRDRDRRRAVGAGPAGRPAAAGREVPAARGRRVPGGAAGRADRAAHAHPAGRWAAHRQHPDAVRAGRHPGRRHGAGRRRRGTRPPGTGRDRLLPLPRRARPRPGRRARPARLSALHHRGVLLTAGAARRLRRLPGRAAPQTPPGRHRRPPAHPGRRRHGHRRGPRPVRPRPVRRAGIRAAGQVRHRPAPAAAAAAAPAAARRLRRRRVRDGGPRRGEVRGFALILRHHDTWYARQTGYDYAYQQRTGAPLYFELLYYRLVEEAAAAGVRAIHYGLGSADTKRSRGCTSSEQRCHLLFLSGRREGAPA